MTEQRSRTALAPLRLYRHPLSGHSHRVELLLSLLRLPYELIDVDLAQRAHKRPEFLAKNPFGQVPVLEDGEVTVADSNAILVYLARRYDDTGAWLPNDALTAARIQRWFSIAAGPLVRGPAAARLAAVFGAKVDVEEARAIGRDLLASIDRALASTGWLVGTGPTLADVALYAYVAHAPEGGIPLQPYDQVRPWLERIRSLPGFVAMRATPLAG